MALYYTITAVFLFVFRYASTSLYSLAVLSPSIISIPAQPYPSQDQLLPGSPPSVISYSLGLPRA